MLLNKAARRRLAFPRVSNSLKLKSGAVPESAAAFVSVLEAKAKDAGTAKKDYKQGDDPLPSCTTLFLAGSESATYGS